MRLAETALAADGLYGNRRIGCAMEVQLTARRGSASNRHDRELVLAGVREVRALSAGLLPERSQRHLDAGLERLRESRFNLVVLGEFKRGKSTLINALIGRELAPVGIVPLTSAVTTLRAGEPERLIVRHVDGRSEERHLDELPAFATESENPHNRLEVEEVVVEIASGLLADGLQLIDTPGIGSVHDHNTAVAESFLPQVDAALCVLAADQPLSASERELFARAASTAPRLLFVVNKVDLLSEEERSQAVAFIEQGLREALEASGIEIFPVSARDGIGLGPLGDRLRELAASEGGTLSLESVRATAAGLAEEAAAVAALEARALEQPLEELERRSALFEERMSHLTTLGLEAGDLLDSGTRRMLHEVVNEPLIAYAKEHGPRLVAELEGYASERGGHSPRELSHELNSWIDSTVRRRFQELAGRYEEEVAAQLAGLERIYASRIEELLADIDQAAQATFGIDTLPRLRDVGLREASRFSFKLKDPEHMLDRLVGVGRRAAPGWFGRRLVLRDARERLVQMVDRHAGRLRSELAGRATEASRAYRRDLAATVDESVEALRSALDRARTEHRRGEHDSSSRLAALAHVQDRLQRLATELGGTEARRKPGPARGPSLP
jgi:small GTP-binding protein